jgi:hypothetical protein
MGGSTAEALGQFQDVFDRQLLDHFMCFPILYPNDRPVSNAVDGEHDLVFVEEPALVDGFGGLDQLPAFALSPPPKVATSEEACRQTGW